MSMQVTSGFVTFIAGEALAIYRRVKLSSGKVVYADEADTAIGVTQSIADADGDPVTVRLLKDAGTYFMTAAGAFSSGTAVKQMNDGKVDDTGSGAVVGTALEAAGADGDQVEILPV